MTVPKLDQEDWTSMKRDDYLNHACVKSFIEWLRPYVRGDKDFRHEYTMLNPECDWSCGSLWEAYKGYVWDGGNFDDNQAKLNRLATRLRRAVEQSDWKTFVEIVLCILDWGGVKNKNADRLLDLGEEALPIFRKASRLLDPSRADTSRLEGFRYMNSGWTKVYSLMLDGFPIYDGRVGAAMGYLVQKHCKEAGLKHVPGLLHFRWSGGRSGNNRNPSSGSLQFYELRHNSPRKWAECNVWAAWVLGKVCDEGRFGNHLLPNVRIRALEAALFMIGDELPVSR